MKGEWSGVEVYRDSCAMDYYYQKVLLGLAPYHHCQ